METIKLGPRSHDLTNRTFGNIKVLRPVGRAETTIVWEFICLLCDKVETRRANAINRYGDNNACQSCSQILKAQGGNVKKHGMSRTKFYAVWRAMCSRCERPSWGQWKDYGGRGIKVSKRWKKFINFRDDMLAEYKEGLQLDRIDNEGDYCLSNCRWVTAQTNANNRRNNRVIQTPDGEMTIAEASRKYDINYSTLCSRLRRGETPIR